MKKGKWWNSLEFVSGVLAGLLLNILSFASGYFLFDKKEERSNYTAGNVIGVVFACFVILVYLILQAVVNKKLGTY